MPGPGRLENKMHNKAEWQKKTTGDLKKMSTERLVMYKKHLWELLIVIEKILIERTLY